jgi:hypothetical protein
MPPRDLSDEEIMALILNFLLSRGRWGGKYYNRQRMTRYLGIQILRDGRRVDKCIIRLLKEGLMLGLKKGATVSLNPNASANIVSIIDTFLKNSNRGL